MKQPAIGRMATLMTAILLLFVQLAANAQDKIVVDKAEVSSWFARNWMWVVGGVILLILIIVLSSGGSSRRKTTTVVKDEFGDVRSVTTTEVNS